MTWMPGGADGWFSVNVSEASFQLKINRRATRLYQNFDDAADVAAKLLYNDWGNRPLYLALSGGIDSELTARILLKNKIPFTPVILKIGTLNQLETWYAEYWCHSNNIVPVILDYSLDEFAKEIARLSPKLRQIKNYNQAPILLIYEYAQQHGGCGIYCGGDINLDLDRNAFYCASLDFVSNLIDVGNHPTSFFMYTPELALSYVYQFNTNKTEQHNKIAFYKVSPRPKIEYVQALRNTEQYQNVIGKIITLFKVDPFEMEHQKHWYGTKEQLIQDLQP